MPLFAQHGFGKSDKLERGIADGSLGGVILNPRYEAPGNLPTIIGQLAGLGTELELMVDPQFYASTLNSTRLGRLPEYAYFDPSLTRRHFTSAASISRYVGSTLGFGMSLPVTALLSPTVAFESFNSVWSQIALTLAQESVTQHQDLNEDRPLYISLVISESALADRSAMDEFLDIVSIIEADGFYVIVQRNSPKYQLRMEPENLENLLYFTYVLAEVNKYDVIFGYADYIGLLLQTVGAHSFACGWHNSLRHFTLARFQESRGARPPRPRYTSNPLLNTILLSPEVDGAREAGMFEQIASNTQYDATATGDPDDWPLDIAVLHHWAALNLAQQEISAEGRVRARLTSMMTKINHARVVYSTLREAGVSFQPETGNAHLDAWALALGNFAATINVRLNT